MSRRSAFGNFGSSAFENDQRLVVLGGFARDGEQFFRLLEALDEGGDHARVFVFDEIVEVFLEGRAGLVAAGNDVT